MPSVSACSVSNGFPPAPKFALVSYIDQPLAGFLDRLRLDLDPLSKPRAHVTLLPPRFLCSSPEHAAREIRSLARQFRPFDIRLGEVAKFPVSNVIHATLASGCDRLREMHRAMNCGPNQFKEGYEYCPHVTIAQNLDDATVDDALERARDAWENYPFDRTFTVERLTFVRSLDCTHWTDIEEVRLLGNPPGVTRTDRPERHPA